MTTLDSVLGWLRAGYPQGVPPKDYSPILALLRRTLSEEQLSEILMYLEETGAIAEGVTPADAAEAIESVTHTEPTADDINKVAARLALVGWPLAAQH